ncbi:unnamed protein product [Didymodactylos carnosus]|uniref:DNA ligase D 3'-phosphoesterase domain-containing protein n=1 Tax=Didymodactylos carnosus TaxID=1234261 RepID=A0A815D7V5_9BILA|nr:unnamed protein product [Didymodactylos carnosus]CAF1297880.1 unnamed protein product [Didymodactylos carnosus]CAF3597437.1 unnamed protein product [Didymodactylos carnosus]CAF4115634.1 unnamed protein product [Didymodactylos carnosus]
MASTKKEVTLEHPNLFEYNKKRDVTKTNEPQESKVTENQYRFVVQEHHATRLHFDFRLEWDGVMKSWSIPKGPSMNPNDKRLAVAVEDHSTDYMYFEGRIPDGEYGAGEVRTWDIGTYELKGTTDFNQQLQNRKLTFRLNGEKLKGEFHMIKTQVGWLLCKKKDEYAVANWQLKQILNYGSRKAAPYNHDEQIEETNGKRTTEVEANRNKRKATTTQIEKKKVIKSKELHNVSSNNSSLSDDVS